MDRDIRDNYEGLQFNEIKQQIAALCGFSLGKQLIYEAAPIKSKLVLSLELKRLQQAMDMTFKYGSMPFGGISDIGDLISMANKNGTLRQQELLKVADHILAVKEIKEYVKNCNCDKDAIAELSDTLSFNEATANHILNAISRSGEVNDNASPKLRSLRRQIKQLQASITAKMASYVEKNRNILQDDIIATRNGRSVVLIKNNYKNTVNGLQYGQSASGGATYLEPAELVGVNNELQNTIDEEQQEVKRILFGLSQEVKANSSDYLGNLETLGILDSLFARAQWAKKHDAIVGEISENMDLVIEQGRHPLIDERKVVANSYHIQKPIRTILITGPNTGGKTVSLKLIGLFVVMHSCGMPLCAREARIPMYDNVFYDIGDNQSIADDLSTFSAHIEKLARICDEATPRSLVILDELGSGTDPLEGEALANAVLDYFRQQQIFTVATTHFPQLKAYGQQYDDILLASVEFDQLNMKPTYRYLENTIGQSNALETARRYDLKPEIIEKAYQFKEAQQTPQDKALEALQKQLDAVKQEREYLDSQLAEVEQQQLLLEQERTKLFQERDSIIEEANQQARDIIYQTREEADEIIDELKSQQNYQINEVAKIKHQLSEMLPQESEEDVVDDSPLEVGDYVRIKVNNQIGEVVALDKKNATVVYGNTKIKSSLTNLEKVNKPKVINTTRARVEHSGNFSIECNLIGKRVDEGIAILDKFMDDALLAKVPFVRIVHGVGTGAMRKAVWDRLKKYKFIKSYEIADGNQGGSGATIAYFREKSDD